MSANSMPSIKLTATPRTAALAGLWAFVGELLIEQLTPPAQTVAGAVVSFGLMIPFFVLPTAMFVIGLDYIVLVFEDRGVRTPTDTCRWLWSNRHMLWTDVYRPLMIRMSCWFAAGACSTLVYATWRHLAS